jgi:hypothetical protein
MHDLYPRACVCDDSQSVSLREKLRPPGNRCLEISVHDQLWSYQARLSHIWARSVCAVSFALWKEFHELGSALYHSAANYTTLDYGDLLLSPAWRLLGPLEANQRGTDVRRFGRHGICRCATLGSGKV